MNFPGRSIQDGEKIYSDWFSRGGDNAIFRAQLIDSEMSGGSPASTVTISVITKNSEDPGDGDARSGRDQAW